MVYETLLREAFHNNLEVYERPMKLRIKGLYADDIIWINKHIQTRIEKGCILAEELGHHFTSAGDILDQEKVENRKQELRARAWAYEKLIPLSSFVQAHKQGIRNRYELADFLCVTEEFLESALERYIEKFGIKVTVGHHTICFEPLGVLEMFE
ncbi:ImmA/IrrE family metallo-endopeptidase [Brevibacillus centrosporus]|uniref:ImmA/IrrE family metallo-endopeptidase n=1 Tax=Brevibacillus centrosporus TaxID=54910 RepID=UPI000F0A01F1|nr:ImmA/IrrE family metallo-endopeptidase [Brevibacillus centrosporus]MEC2131712.1 ImmA/IrrE family metallo-endopeptidase [Brevibacillus centrosporus]RNB67360.1 ImmA/IrrE family metallo-endopeptidase [Brevibacillus centrosporus]GED33988.1 membrane protein [Brevibacillus centrosporus]